MVAINQHRDALDPVSSPQDSDPEPGHHSSDEAGNALPSRDDEESFLWGDERLEIP